MPVAEGMVVKTQSPMAVKARKGVMEFLWSTTRWIVPSVIKVVNVICKIRRLLLGMTVPAYRGSQTLGHRQVYGASGFY